MKFKKLNRKKGFTLIELILAVALIGIVITLSVNLLIFGNKVQSKTINQYDIQSSLRITTEKINEIVRYSKAVFAVPQTFVDSTSAMDPDWYYLMVSSDGKKIVNMVYNEGTGKHEEEIQVDEQEGVSYKVLFEKNKTSLMDTVMEYSIYAYLTDDDGNIIKEEVVFKSTVEAVNSIQVVDKGTELAKSIALAYRAEGQTSGKGKNTIAYISIIVDTSGSMNDIITDKENIKKSRIDRVRSALTGTEGIIHGFAKEENVFISLVPFAETANYPDTNGNSEPSSEHPIYEIYENTDKNAIITRINSSEVKGGMKASGNTNTGDGLRAAYHLHNNFRNRMSIDSKTQVQHYSIILIDGETNRGVKEGSWTRFLLWWFFNSSSNYYTSQGNIYINNKDYDYNVVSDSTGYVKKIGDLITAFEGGNGIKSYIIGYANNLEGPINKIGSDIGTLSDNIYRYDAPDFDLDEVLRDIANDIMADYRLLTGPQIQN